ncbi:hypothetical protein [Limnoglobus roseus]|uniref:Uncharacterized protein n=1 Tax=Limnoglobus roseus TaxID=2598579 RepID=A0A5C1AAI3_9BACT|nr:hypothetical protein [Limnoglobus roseus]QEL14832.1 hypothetical protein PX52LOC_01730 [Limnoglobus roseus]
MTTQEREQLDRLYMRGPGGGGGSWAVAGSYDIETATNVVEYMAVGARCFSYLSMAEFTRDTPIKLVRFIYGEYLFSPDMEVVHTHTWGEIKDAMIRMGLKPVWVMHPNTRGWENWPRDNWESLGE